MSTNHYEAPRIYVARRYRDCLKMIDWLERTFGFTRHVVYEDGKGGVAHSQLALGSAMIMLGSARDDEFGKIAGRPGNPGDGTSVYIAVDDVDGLHDRVKAAGGEITWPLNDTDYGSREFGCRDPEGLYWHFGSYWPKADEAPKG